MDSLNILFGIVGVVGLLATIYSTRVLNRGLKIGTLQELRMLINRLESSKRKLDPNSQAWAVMHTTQEDLDTSFKKIQVMFAIKDKDAPLN